MKSVTMELPVRSPGFSGYYPGGRKSFTRNPISIDLLVSITIWLSVAAWGAGIAFACRWPVCGRNLLTAGLIFYVLHAIAAFEGFYGWSHATAYTETARQTEEMTGWRSGFGLWLNYFFALVWLGDLLYWWFAGYQCYRMRSGWISGAVHGFMAFMIFNGTVVFGDGPVRWFGIAVFAGLIASRFVFRGK